jgi:hypothetical protein
MSRNPDSRSCTLPDKSLFMTAAERQLATDKREALAFVRLMRREDANNAYGYVKMALLSAQLVAARLGWSRSRALVALEGLEAEGELRRVRRRGAGHWEATDGKRPASSKRPTRSGRNAERERAIWMEDMGVEPLTPEELREIEAHRQAVREEQRRAEARRYQARKSRLVELQRQRRRHGTLAHRREETCAAVRRFEYEQFLK